LLLFTFLLPGTIQSARRLLIWDEESKSIYLSAPFLGLSESKVKPAFFNRSISDKNIFHLKCNVMDTLSPFLNELCNGTIWVRCFQKFQFLNSCFKKKKWSRFQIQLLLFYN